MRVKAHLWSKVVVLAGVYATVSFGSEMTVVEPGQVALEFSQRSWQHEHGLPAGDRVHAILQTRDGYLWIGTQYGLARFDGRRFTVFDHVNTPELRSDDCRTLAEDLDENIWIGTKDSLIRRAANRFTSFGEKLGSERISYPPLCASRDGGVWVGGRGAVYRIRVDTVTIHLRDQALPAVSGAITALEEDNAGYLWVGATTGFGRFDARRGRFENIEMAGGFERRPVMDIWQPRDGQLWILFAEFVPGPGKRVPDTWIVAVDPGQWPKRQAVRTQALGPGWPGHSLVGDAERGLWLAGGPKGIRRYRNNQVELLPILSRGTDDKSLCAFPDREGNIWVGTDKSGLHCWTPRKVSTWTTREGLAHDNVWSIWETRDGGVLVGTDRGVTKIKGDKTRKLQRPDGSSPQDVRAVAEDGEGTIWVGTMRSLERISEEVTTPIELPGEWFETKIRALHPSRDGSMWVGTVRGLTRIEQGKRTKYTQADGLGSEEVRAILECRSGDLWVGTLGGGCSRFRNGRFTTLTTTNGLSSNNVWVLHEDSDGVLWMGTDNGLTCLLDGRLTAFTTAEGLPAPLVNSIVSDDLGRLWIGHDRGIYSLEKRQLREVANKQRTTLNPVSYDESDGLLSVETNGQKSSPSACRTRDGRLWFPTTQGVAVFNPAKVEHSPAAPLAAIEEVRANGRQVLGDHPQGPAVGRPAGRLKPRGFDLELPPGGARVLEFHYTANTFVAPEKARFKYRLVGLDDHWIDAGPQRQAYFTDLRSGTYRFEVIACNHHGIWQEKASPVAFYLAPFYYQTWWFYLVCGAALVVLIGLVAVWRARELQRIYELQRNNALNEQRRQIARDIHDELGASLTHILQLSERARQGAVRPGTPELPAERIAAIAGEAVDNIGEIVWANNPEYDTLEDLVAYLREHAAGFFADSSLTIRFDFPEAIPTRTVTGWFRRHLVLVLKEALQNIAKHAHARSVNIRLCLNNGLLELNIADDGRGFSGGPSGSTGNGLANMKHRVNELGGTFQIQSQPGQGTQINVVAPLTDR